MTKQDNDKQTKPQQPEDKKFVVLVILASVLILLLWVATIPFNFHSRDNGAAGPRAVLQFIGEQISTSRDSIKNARDITNAE